MSEHTAKAFDVDLQELNRCVAQMGGLVEGLVVPGGHSHHHGAREERDHEGAQRRDPAATPPSDPPARPLPLYRFVRRKTGGCCY